MSNILELSPEKNLQHNKVHYFDKTPIDLAASEYGLQDFAHIVADGTHVIQGYSFHYILRGSGVFCFANKRVRCTSGDIIITFPNVPIQFIPDKDDPWKYFYMLFNEKTAIDLVSFANFSLTNPTYSIKHTEEVDAIIENLCENDSNKLTNKFRSLGALCEIFSYVIEERNITTQIQRVDKEYFVQQAIRIIEQKSSDANFRISHICDEIGISYSYLSKLFSTLVGSSATDYLINYRMREARFLLDHGVSVGSVAEKCGYNSFAHFSNQFKKMFGLTPSQYREWQRKNLRTPPTTIHPLND